MSTVTPLGETSLKLNEACKSVEAAMRTIIETLPSLELNDAVSLMPHVTTLQQVRRDIALNKAFG
jgi:hypothetical protein